MDNEQTIGIVKKNREKNLLVSVGDYQDRIYIYLQTIEADDNKGDPSQPRSSLRPETVRGLIPLFTQALELAETLEAAKLGNHRDHSRTWR